MLFVISAAVISQLDEQKVKRLWFELEFLIINNCSHLVSKNKNNTATKLYY